MRDPRPLYASVRTTFPVSNGFLLSVHPRKSCAGEFCSVHRPSPHHMRDWPQLWRADRYLMERTCPHGVGHPDPDDLAWKRRAGMQDAAGVHGCDGCCG